MIMTATHTTMPPTHHRPLLRAATFLAAAILVLASPTQAQETKVVADTGGVDDQFGSSVAISADGQRALVGAPLDDEGSGNEGSVYVFNRQADGSWLQQTRLTLSDGQQNERFGVSVVISPDGQHALINVFLEERAYVFDRQSDGLWTQQAVLTASDGESGDTFGASVSISNGGAYALVGADGDNIDSEFDVGSAYVFSRQSDGSYVEEMKLTASNGDGDDNFGNSVSITPDGQRALIGAVGDASAYVFDRQSDGSWVEEDNFEEIDGDLFNDFGRAVSISADGERALVGADGDVDGGFDAQGAAYVFDRQSDGTWTQQAEFIAPDGGFDDHLGISVAISGDGQRALLGANQDDVNGNERQGSAYVIARQPDGSWIQQAKLTASDGEETDRFGGAVALSADGQRGLVGAHFDDVNDNLTQGSVYVYGPASLPVELVAFDAVLDGATVTLSWRTATETSNAGFAIERRADGEAAWQKVAFVEGAGTTSDPQAYQFSDANLPFRTGILVYRLRQIDLDGTATPSPSVEVVVGGADEFAFHPPFPNPSADAATLRYALPQPTQVRLALYNLLGRHVATLVEGTVPAGRNEVRVDLQQFAPGVYLAVLDAGDTRAVRRVVVVK